MTTTIHLMGIGQALDGTGRPIMRNLGTAEDMDEARELARFFLSDPRDTIETVHFFDVGRQQFKGWLNREGLTR